MPDEPIPEPTEPPVVEISYGVVLNGVLDNFATAADPHFALMMGWKPLTGNEQIGWLWSEQGFVAPAPLPYNRAAAGRAIDDAVAAVYTRFTRFGVEYTEREAQAQAFKDAGYTGEPGPRVLDFSVPAGLPTNMAVDLILQQAANLRAAMDDLSALRMRKYEITRAATDVIAEATAESILAEIKVIDNTIS